MTIYKTVIVDDEPEARAGIELLLKTDPSIQIVGVCKNGLEAIRQIHQAQPDLLFLDIQMPKISGMEVLSSLAYYPPAIIFTTAFDEYAIQAFEWQALDYLLKPYSDERFFQALERGKKAVEQQVLQTQNEKLKQLTQQFQNQANSDATEWIPSPKNQWDRLVFKASGKIHFVKETDVYFLEAYDNYVKIHTKTQTYLIRNSLKQLEQNINPSVFTRIHKSFIVNMNKVLQMEPYFKGDSILTLESGQKLKVSRNYKGNLHPFL